MEKSQKNIRFQGCLNFALKIANDSELKSRYRLLKMNVFNHLSRAKMQRSVSRK